MVPYVFWMGSKMMMTREPHFTKTSSNMAASQENWYF
jgi:hypothetical protein